MADTRAWLVAALVVIGLAVLVTFGSGQRGNHGRVRAAVGARAVQQQMPAPPTPPHHGR